MSDQPLSKRQKRGDGGRALALALALGGPMYDEATARKILKETVLASAEVAALYGHLFSNAENGEAVVGFDPDDAALNNTYFVSVDQGVQQVTPMIYFALKGDVKMCRYLASRGASPTQSTRPWSPMYAAARQGHVEVCKFLHANGASIGEDSVVGGWPPFNSAVFHDHDELARWLVLQRVLCADGSSEEIEIGREHLIYPLFCFGNESRISRSCERLVEWAKEVTESHSSLMMFLLGALPPAPGKNQSRTLQCLSGHPGVRKHIGNFVGLEVTKAKQLRILRNVVEVLPSLIRTDEDEE